MKLFKKYSFRNKLPRSLGLRNSGQSGQAMIEYVLVVIIAITMLFAAKGLFTNLNDYISGYVGGYFKCLMIQGELPALGVSDAQNLAKHTSGNYKCTASLKKTDIAQGGGDGTKNIGTATLLSSQAPKGSTKATASSRAGASSSADKKANSSKKKRSNGSGDSDDDDSTRFSANIRNRSEAYSSSDSEGDDDVRSVPMARRDLSSETPPSVRRVSEDLDAALKKKMRGRGTVARDKAAKTITSPDDDMRPGPRRTKLNPPQRAVAAVMDDGDTEMGFGYFLKWIMIAGLGIAIFVFFGSQIMNYNNSDS